MTFARLDHGYRLTDAERGIVLDVSRLRRERHNLVGELVVGCRILGARSINGDGPISVASFNLSDVRARKERAAILTQQARTKDQVDWLTLLEALCQKVLTAEREGEPAIVLRDLDRPEPDEHFDVQGFSVPRTHPAILFGDGGALKSYTALHVLGTIAASGVRCALIDWEMDQFTHRGRLERLFPQAMPDVRYVRCDRPLVHEVDRLAAIVTRDRIEYAAFDSCGFACDGAPEYAEQALAYFRAVRQLGIGSLHIAHTTKTGDNAEYRPFGSAFWHNSARCTWFAKQAAVSPDGQVITVGLFNRKINVGALARPVAFDVNFMATRTVFTRVEVSDVEELADTLPLWQRIQTEIRSKPRTIADLADRLNAKAETIDRTVRRKSAVFAKVSGSDGIQRIALVERRAS